LNTSKNAVFIAVLVLGNLTVSLQASPLRLPKEERYSENDKSTVSYMAGLLRKQGLENDAALHKAEALLAHGPYTLTDFERLCGRLDGAVTMTQLEKVLVKHALFEKPIDLASAHDLIGLMHEATGKAPDETQRRTLREIALRHSAVDGRNV